VRKWAAMMGRPVEHLIVAIVVGSESLPGARTPVHEQLAIAHTMINRLAYDHWRRDLWWIAVGKSGRTGSQGAREYASSRPPSGERLQHMLGVAEAAFAQNAQGYTFQGITHFHHYGDTQRGREVTARWVNQLGYQLKHFEGMTTTFRAFAPSASKAHSLGVG
jgi:hypothetical protein